MKLIALKCGAAEKLDRLTFVRADGNRCEIDMPRQGVLPHDLVHFVVEQGLRLRDGFLSRVAAGAQARYVMERVHEVRHSEVLRSAMLAEAIVEALQTQLWAGALDYEAFVYGIRTAAEVRGIEAPAPPAPAQAEGLFEQARALHEQWSAVPPSRTLELTFEPSVAAAPHT